MKVYLDNILKHFFRKTEKEVDREIDILNLGVIYYVSLAMTVIQIVSLVVYLVSRFIDPTQTYSMGVIMNVITSIILCILGFIFSGYFKRQKDIIACQTGINIFVILYVILLLIWGALASGQTYKSGGQIITFFTVELIVVLFIKLRPLFSSAIIIVSYTAFYFALNILIRYDIIDPYNYFLMAALSIVGAIIAYQTTVNYIEQKIKSDNLNESLVIVANHDALTNLKNRYALNKVIPDYVGEDICVAMMDINNFKKVNDTYGHRMGDEVLIALAGILLFSFEHEEVYRYGGDEFLIVSRGRDYAAFCAKLDELNEKFSKVHIEGIDESFSFSFGSVSYHPETVTDFLDMIVKADKKLYDAKDLFKAKKQQQIV